MSSPDPRNDRLDNPTHPLRHMADAGRTSIYRVVPERTPPLGPGYPAWLVPGKRYEGFILADGPLESLIVLFEPEGEDRVEVLGSWVERMG